MSTAFLRTTKIAADLDCKPASILTALWRNGHFNGVRPVKLPNGRLLWPADTVARITGGVQA